MENSTKDSLLISLVWGGVVAVIFITIITILGELVKATVDGESVKVVKDFMKESLLWGKYEHHWVGKGIWAVILFAGTTGISYLFTRKKEVSNDWLAEAIRLLSWLVIIGSVILLGFFLYEYNIHH